MQLKSWQYSLLDPALLAEQDFILPPELYIDGNFIQFAGKRLAIFTSEMPPQNAGNQFIHTDVAILAQNANVRIPQIMETYRPEIIVIDASNSKARIDRWEKECAEAEVRCHRVDRDGAFVLNN